MELYIKEKYNTLIKIMSETNDNECICELTSTISDSSNRQYFKNNILKNSLNNNINDNINDNIEMIKLNKNLEDDFSLLDDNNIEVINLSVGDDSTIKSEFKSFFNNNKLLKKINNKKHDKINNTLEKLYNKFSTKRNSNHNINQKLNYDLTSIINNYKNINNINNLLKLITNNMKFTIFNESTRGWNYDNNIYILNFEKLKDNFKKINLINSNINIGCLYRNYNNNKSFFDRDFSKYWISLNYSNNKLEEVEFPYRNKMLTYCLKNLIIKNKFKKTIGSSIIRCFKKTVQVYGNPNLLIDIVFYVRYKKNI